MWRFLVVLLVLVLYLVPAGVVLADSSADITVTASGWVWGAPFGLTIRYISDFEVELEWEKPAPYTPEPPGTVTTVVNTLVRIKWSEAPGTRDDGYLVYYGDNSTYLDTTIDLTSAQLPYYRLWAETVFYDVSGDIISNEWEEIGTTGGANFMSISFLFIGLILLTLGVTATSFWRRSIVLTMGASLGWLSLGMLFVTNSVILGQFSLSEVWMQTLAFLLFSMVFGCLLWYIAGIGKTSITITDGKRTWAMWERPPKEAVKSRATLVKERHRERLKATREHRRLR